MLEKSPYRYPGDRRRAIAKAIRGLIPEPKHESTSRRQRVSRGRTDPFRSTPRDYYERGYEYDGGHNDRRSGGLFKIVLTSAVMLGGMVIIDTASGESDSIVDDLLNEVMERLQGSSDSSKDESCLEGFVPRYEVVNEAVVSDLAQVALNNNIAGVLDSDGSAAASSDDPFTSSELTCVVSDTLVLDPLGEQVLEFVRESGPVDLSYDVAAGFSPYVPLS